MDGVDAFTGSDAALGGVAARADVGLERGLALSFGSDTDGDGVFKGRESSGGQVVERCLGRVLVEQAVRLVNGRDGDRSTGFQGCAGETVSARRRNGISGGLWSQAEDWVRVQTHAAESTSIVKWSAK